MMVHGEKTLYGTEVNPNDAASIQDFVNDYLEGENVNDNFEDEHLDYFDYLSQELHLPVSKDFVVARQNFLALLRVIEIE